MLNAVGYVIKQADGHYKGTLRTVRFKAEIDILSNTAMLRADKSTFV